MPTFEHLLAEYFDPDRAPYAIGLYVNEIYQATQVQLKKAERLLKNRRRRYPWQQLSEQESKKLIEKSESKTEFSEVWVRDLPFYTGSLAPVRLLHFEPQSNAPHKAMRALIDNEDKIHPLDGNSPPIHKFNKLIADTNNGMAVSNEQSGAIEEYLSFFCNHLSNDGKIFYLVEEDDRDRPFRLIPASHDEREDLSLSREGTNGNHSPSIRTAYPITQITLPDGEDEDANDEAYPPLLASVVYGNKLARAVFRISFNGNVDMLDDQPLENVIIKPIRSTWLLSE